MLGQRLPECGVDIGDERLKRQSFAVRIGHAASSASYHNTFGQLILSTELKNMCRVHMNI
jgi:hypothetical protein